MFPYRMHSEILSSLESYGINYSDPYPLEYPRITRFIGVNRYLYQVKNFHQVLRMKFCYHCVRTNRTTISLKAKNNCSCLDSLLLFSPTLLLCSPIQLRTTGR